MLIRTAQKFSGRLVIFWGIIQLGKLFRRTGTFSELTLKGDTILTDLESSWQTLKRLPRMLEFLTTLESGSAGLWSHLIRQNLSPWFGIYWESERGGLGTEITRRYVGTQMNTNSFKYPLAAQCRDASGSSEGVLSWTEGWPLFGRACVCTLMLIFWHKRLKRLKSWVWIYHSLVL